MTLAGTLDPFAPESRDDPYPVYARLRNESPVHEADPGTYLVSRYDDIAEVLKDHRWSSDPTTASRFDPSEGVVFGGGDAQGRGAIMLFSDPPDHTRLRSLVNKAFAARAMEGLRPRVQTIVDELLDAAAERGSIDVMQDLAFPLPVIVICELLGVPAAERNRFKEIGRGVAGILDLRANDSGAMELVQRVAPKMMELVAYFASLIDERRKEPREDLLSALIAAEEAGDSLTQGELMGMCILLFIAGHETTMNLIGNGTYALLRNPTELERWRSDPSLDRTAIEELLRYDSPVQLTARNALEDVVVGGVAVPKGDGVTLLLGAANRDPAHFADPERLDLGRKDNRHMSFGGGHHFCVGAPLARVEGQVAIGTLVRRFPGVRLTEEPAWRGTMVLRGLESLHVDLR